MRISIYDKWHKAFIYFLSKEKRGIQARLSEKTNTSTQHISDIVTGKRGASQILQEELAKELGTSYEDMLQIGTELSKDSNSELLEPSISLKALLPKIKKLDNQGLTALSGWIDGYLSMSEKETPMEELKNIVGDCPLCGRSAIYSFKDSKNFKYYSCDYCTDFKIYVRAERLLTSEKRKSELSELARNSGDKDKFLFITAIFDKNAPNSNQTYRLDMGFQSRTKGQWC